MSSQVYSVCSSAFGSVAHHFLSSVCTFVKYVFVCVLHVHAAAVSQYAPKVSCKKDKEWQRKRCTASSPSNSYSAAVVSTRREDIKHDVRLQEVFSALASPKLRGHTPLDVVNCRVTNAVCFDWQHFPQRYDVIFRHERANTRLHLSRQHGSIRLYYRSSQG
jgi:hypothetical protein